MNMELNTDTLILLALAAALSIAVGYLISALRSGRVIASLTNDNDTLAKQINLITERANDAEQETLQVKSELHHLEIEQGKDGERLSSLQATEKRLEKEISTLKEGINGLEKQLNEVSEAHSASEKLLSSANTDIRARQNQIEDLRDQLSESKQAQTEQQNEYKTLQGRYQSLDSELTELKTTLEQKEQHFAEQLKQLEDGKDILKKEFENAANKIFEEKGKSFSQTSSKSIQDMLKPFSEKIEGFQKRVNEIHDASIKGNTDLGAEIRKVLDIGLKMSSEANNLTSALKGDSQQRGAWGEAQLQRTLEMSGLVEDAHFETQSSFRDTDGKSKRTDYLVKLPDGKHIIIDSKVSLVDYDRSVSAETEDAAQIALNDHIKAVKAHIDDLASKDYTNLIGMRSPSFVLMFMPIEAAYIEALKHQKDLFEYGYSKNIVLVSHTTLIPILRTVSNLWMIERSNAEAREISDKAADIFNQVCTVAERLKKLGNTLGTASNHYNDTITAMAGNRGLYGKVERFSKLSTKVSKTLPVLEPEHRDVETERLSLIVEQIEDEVVNPNISSLTQHSVLADNDMLVNPEEETNTEESEKA